MGFNYALEITNTKMITANKAAGHLLCMEGRVLKGTQRMKLVLGNHLTGSRAKTPCLETRDLCLANSVHRRKGARGYLFAESSHKRGTP